MAGQGNVDPLTGDDVENEGMRRDVLQHVHEDPAARGHEVAHHQIG